MLESTAMTSSTLDSCFLEESAGGSIFTVSRASISSSLLSIKEKLNASVMRWSSFSSKGRLSEHMITPDTVYTDVQADVWDHDSLMCQERHRECRIFSEVNPSMDGNGLFFPKKVLPEKSSSLLKI